MAPFANFVKRTMFQCRLWEKSALQVGGADRNRAVY